MCECARLRACVLASAYMGLKLCMHFHFPIVSLNFFVFLFFWGGHVVAGEVCSVVYRQSFCCCF